MTAPESPTDPADPSPSTASTGLEPRRMTVASMLAYGSGDFYGGGSLFIISTLYVVFLTTVVGMGPVYGGTIVLVGKVWAGVANPVMGYISDHTVSRYGRRRMWFLVGLFPIFTILWIPVRFENDASTFAWHLCMYLIADTMLTIVKVPYNSILAEMTSDYAERSRATGIRMLFSQAGAFTGAMLPLTIIGWFGGGGRGYLVMGAVFGILYSIPWIFEFLYTWERDVVVPTSEGSLSKNLAELFRAFGSTLRNRTFRIHMAMYLTAFANLDTFNGLYVFFMTLSLGHDRETARNVLMAVQGSQIVALPLVTVACYRFGNAMTYRLSLMLWGAGILLFASMPSTASAMMMYGYAAIVGLGLSGAILTPWNIQSFMPDVDELMTTRRREGVYAGFMQFARQIAIGVGLFGTNVVLAWMGFVRGSTVQPPAVGQGIRAYLIVAPIVFLGSGILLSLRFKLDPRNHTILLDEIRRLRGGGQKAAVDPETRRICEMLTGHAYDRLWRPPA